MDDDNPLVGMLIECHRVLRMVKRGVPLPDFYRREVSETIKEIRVQLTKWRADHGFDDDGTNA